MAKPRDSPQPHDSSRDSPQPPQPRDCKPSSTTEKDGRAQSITNRDNITRKVCHACENGDKEEGCEWNKVDIGGELRRLADELKESDDTLTNKNIRYQTYRAYHRIVKGPGGRHPPLPLCVEGKINETWPKGLHIDDPAHTGFKVARVVKVRRSYKHNKK